MRTILMLGWWALTTPVVAVLTLPYALLTGNSNFLYRLSMWVVLIGLKLGNVRFEIIGRDQLDPAQTYIFMSNHVSNLDPPLLMPQVPNRTSVLVKKELFRTPILGFAMRVAHLVAVDRSNRDAAVASVREAAQVMRSGLNMMIFPEGTRSRDGRLLPFKKGPFYLAIESGFPIVPVTLVGTDEIWPKGKLLMQNHKAKAQLVFHTPIWPNDYDDRDALIAAVRDAIASALPEDRR
ncbi:MAG: 1-acyl-sn-glycerol-3-phosphate acyltransferase [Acidobacteriia bacterium]|nr:1-acyl-sn-glycerol-3-phosphate acyltransferase [Terriglobia bacterium]